MTTGSSTDLLREAFVALPPNKYSADDERLSDLHPKVCAVVDDLRAAGMQPEHVILTVKGIAMEAGVSGLRASGLMDRMVRWCLRQYFKE